MSETENEPERTDFDDDLDAQLALEPDFATVDVLVNKKLRKLRFTEMDGLAWADLTDRCPPRPDAAVDRAFGYNLRLVVALAVTRCGQMQSGEDFIDLTEKQWTNLLRGQPGSAIRSIGDALFQLNQWGPAQAVKDARKALEVESAMKSLRPDLSTSPDPVSSDVNPESEPSTPTTSTDDSPVL